MSEFWHEPVDWEVAAWLGKTFGRCSICGRVSAETTGGWVGPWETAVYVELCPTCRGEGE